MNVLLHVHVCSSTRTTNKPCNQRINKKEWILRHYCRTICFYEIIHWTFFVSSNLYHVSIRIQCNGCVHCHWVLKRNYLRFDCLHLKNTAFCDGLSSFVSVMGSQVLFRIYIHWYWEVAIILSRTATGSSTDSWKGFVLDVWWQEKVVGVITIISMRSDKEFNSNISMAKVVTRM